MNIIGKGNVLIIADQRELSTNVPSKVRACAIAHLPEPCSARLKSVAHRKACPSKGAMHTHKVVHALGSIVCLPACMYCMCAVWRALGPGGDSRTIQGSSVFLTCSVLSLRRCGRSVQKERCALSWDREKCSGHPKRNVLKTKAVWRKTVLSQ